ncbi:MAG: hypothetical protein Q4G59_11110 [Planctomycetia bacterium]|nr:hypothetical protein [Planctomycetia bacterium]
MTKHKYYYRRRSESESMESGQDSFLDIVSNVVGILIILVMIAGAQVGAIHSPSEEKQPTVPDPVAVSLPSDPAPTSEESSDKSLAVSRDEMLQYVQIAKKFGETKSDILTMQKETQSQNLQLERTKQRADSAQIEHQNMLENITKLEAAIELESRKKSESDKKAFDRRQELARLDAQAQTLAQTRDTLAKTKTTPKLLQNVPTPLAKKVDGHEAFFCLRRGKISHVPMNVFTERIRGMFSGIRSVKEEKIDKTIGPVEDYSFHFQASTHQVRHADGIEIVFSFDYGEFIPATDDVGETAQAALTQGSKFDQKLSMYLNDNSTITLFVYPDSFDLLRQIKQHLLDHKFVIALRPMPANQNITISPHGTASTTY